MAKSFYKSRQFQTRLYGGLSIVLLLVIGFYSYSNVMKMLGMQAEIDTHNQLHSALANTENRIDEELSTVKEENIDLNQTIQEERDVVFPKGENHTALTRTLEQFANDTHRSKNPFMISNLQYQTPKKSESGEYMILPFKLTIHCSYENFFKYLEYVGNSGTLSDKTRLIDIQQIIINFVSPQGTQGNISGQDEINFNVSMQAYFRS
ncbi:hypothetical protein ACFL3C_03330 [Patescibacteria group bacterium]